MTAAYVSTYVLSASQGRGRRMHAVLDGWLHHDDTFKTYCGLSGVAKKAPWIVGQTRRENVTCARCRKAIL